MEIRLNNVSYKDKLRSINYVFEENDITSIIGINGFDSSLLSLIVLNFVDDYDGNIIVDGKLDYDKEKYLKNIGFVSNNPNSLFNCCVVEDEISMYLKNNDFKLDRINKKMEDVLKMVGLPLSILKRKVVDLSSGEVFKVILASALSLNPKVLLLDEPTMYLDGKGKKELLKLLLLLKNKYKKTIIVVSNDIDFVYSLGGNYILLGDEGVYQEGKINDWKYDSNIFLEYKVDIPFVLRFVNCINKKSSINMDGVKDIFDIVERCFGDE